MSAHGTPVIGINAGNTLSVLSAVLHVIRRTLKVNKVFFFNPQNNNQSLSKLKDMHFDGNKFLYLQASFSAFQWHK